MGMTTFSYFEYYLTMLGWAISNGVWNGLTASGIAILPVLAIFLQSFIQVRERGDTLNVEAITKNVETRLWVSYIVILFACIPWPALNLGEVKVDTTSSCGVSSIEHDETRWGGEFATIGNIHPHVPIWFNFVHLVSKSITGVAIATIPCNGDIRATIFEIDNQRIANPVLVDEVGQFTNECYAEARVKFFRDRNVSESWTDASGLVSKYEAGWIGAKVFLDAPGYYDSMRALTPQKFFPWNEARDEGLAPGQSGGGYPSCKSWWEDPQKGLRTRLAEQIKPETLERASSILRWGENATDSMIRNLVSPSAQQRSKDMGSPFYNMGPSTSSGVAGAADWARETYNNFKITSQTGPFGNERDKASARAQAMRAALPMLQPIAYLVLVISTPIVLVLSGYSLGAMIQLSMGMFLIHFLHFWWELSRWLDSRLLAGLYMNQGMDAAATRMLPWTDHGAAYWMADIVLWGSLVAMPLLFVVFMGWAGMRGATALVAAFGMTGAAGDAAKVGENTGGGMGSLAGKAGSTAAKAGGRAASRAAARAAARRGG